MKDIRRATRRHFSAEDKIRIVLEPDVEISEFGRSTNPLRGRGVCGDDEAHWGISRLS